MSVAAATLPWMGRSEFEPEVGPGPEGTSLVLSVPCRTQRAGGRGRPHGITIEPDWTVLTPHDLEAERVAVAFGGFSSCLELVDAVIPAVRRAAGLLSRRRLPALRPHPRTGRVDWRVPSATACRCRGTAYGSAQAAAGHLRTPAHLSAQYDVSADALSRVTRVVEGGWAAHQLDSAAATTARRLVQHPQGLRDLWEAGISPDAILAMAALAADVMEPLPPTYYLGVAYSGVDRAWLSRTLRLVPDPQVASWLAWLSPERTRRLDDVGPFLLLGLSRGKVLALADEAVPYDQVTALAQRTRRTLRTAGRDLAAWAAIGARPTVEHLRLLDAYGLGEATPPSRRVVDLLSAHSEAVGASVDRTELAVLVTLTGTRGAVEQLVADGIHTVHAWTQRASGRSEAGRASERGAVAR